MKFKIGKYFTTYSITAGFFIAGLGSTYLYMAWFDLSNKILETILALLFFWFLLQAERKIWFWSGFFIALLWFWWIMVSFKHYQMLWAIPLGLLFISLVYGGIFWLLAWGSEKLASFLPSAVAAISPYEGVLVPQGHFLWAPTPYKALFRAFGLLGLSYLHPLSFDWFKPELLFVHTYIGVQKWQLAIVLLAILLAQYRKNILFLLLVLLAYSPSHTKVIYQETDSPITLANTMTTVEDKWNPKLIPSHIIKVFKIIDKAISKQKQMVVLPESVFPFFLNNESKILSALLQRSKQITIIIGALYLDEKRVHRNATYIIQNGTYTIANKVLLVPFGESNPLPEWAGKWVNKVFFDDAVDYIASAKPTNFTINKITYRNAICYEACSETLYKEKPKQMIVTSNNGWFIPSIEPTLQRLLLEFYNRKYGTTIYHSVNMSPSYTIRQKSPW